MDPSVFIHPHALVETDAIGPRTRIWAFAHVMKNVVIGPDCNICDHSFIESGAVIGRGVTVKTHVAIGEGVTLRDGVFIGPHTVFTNDLRPRSPRLPLVASRYREKKNWLVPTLVEEGATLGAGVVVLCGITIGAWSVAGAGAVLMRDVPPFTLMLGNPARPTGYVCACGATLILENGVAQCAECGLKFHHDGQRLQPDQPINLWSI
jgi:acetyltransferase-like isoleucine patch superfamily enzyme